MSEKLKHQGNIVDSSTEGRSDNSHVVKRVNNISRHLDGAMVELIALHSRRELLSFWWRFKRPINLTIVVWQWRWAGYRLARQILHREIMITRGCKRQLTHLRSARNSYFRCYRYNTPPALTTGKLTCNFKTYCFTVVECMLK